MPRVQYSLGSLFVFTLAFGAFVSALSVLQLVGKAADSKESTWTITATILVTWTILVGFYSLRDRWVEMLLHFFGFGVAAASWPLFLVFQEDHLADAWEYHGVALLAHYAAVCCLAGTLLSFPVYVLGVAWRFGGPLLVRLRGGEEAAGTGETVDEAAGVARPLNGV